MSCDVFMSPTLSDDLRNLSLIISRGCLFCMANDKNKLLMAITSDWYVRFTRRLQIIDKVTFGTCRKFDFNPPIAFRLKTDVTLNFCKFLDVYNKNNTGENQSDLPNVRCTTATHPLTVRSTDVIVTVTDMQIPFPFFTKYHHFSLKIDLVSSVRKGKRCRGCYLNGVMIGGNLTRHTNMEFWQRKAKVTTVSTTPSESSIRLWMLSTWSHSTLADVVHTHTNTVTSYMDFSIRITNATNGRYVESVRAFDETSCRSKEYPPLVSLAKCDWISTLFSGFLRSTAAILSSNCSSLNSSRT